ncbi:MAG: response regulator [Parvibaculum sp.]|nr:response regulator [Parvibaculum sp.]
MNPPGKLPKPVANLLDKKTYSRLNVMVVEDASHMASLVCGILKSLGFGRIFEARNGTDALDIMNSQAIDLVLIDDLAPPMDGLSVVKELRKSKSNSARRIPVILLTSILNKSAIVDARDAGVTEILSKPFSAAQMIARIESVLSRPRELIETEHFAGPDRRRREKEAPEHRRQSDQKA